MRNKWELIEECIHGTKVTFNPILGYSREVSCVYDVFRKKKWNGLYKYKKVER